MSDPITNVEIEDVLSSIRRLVSDGDKARMREASPFVRDVPAPEVSVTQLQNKTTDDAASSESKADRLVLTPALMVVDAQPLDDFAKIEVEKGTDDGWFVGDDDKNQGADVDFLKETESEVQALEEQPTLDTAEPDTAAPHAVEEDGQGDAAQGQMESANEMAEVSIPEGPLELTNMVWEPIEPVEHFEDGGDAEDTPLQDIELHNPDPHSPDLHSPAPLTTAKTSVPVAQEPVEQDLAPKGLNLQGTPVEALNRTDLVATIAELEAAVSSDDEDYEPDGSEVMGQTIAWPGAVAHGLDTTEGVQSDSEPQAEFSSEDLGVEATEVPVFARHFDAPEPLDIPSDDVAPTSHADPVVDAETTSHADPVEQDIYEDDDLDGLLEETGNAALDEEALRALVSKVVLEELTGPLGERITRNVRKLVRREIHRILSSQDFD